jgi:hypothetical protein
MNNLIEIYVNGDWNTSLEECPHIEIYDKGDIYVIKAELYDKFIDDLEKNGYNCYLCPQLFSHPNWNGIIKHI